MRQPDVIICPLISSATGAPRAMSGKSTWSTASSLISSSATPRRRARSARACLITSSLLRAILAHSFKGGARSDRIQVLRRLTLARSILSSAGKCGPALVGHAPLCLFCACAPLFVKVLETGGDAHRERRLFYEVANFRHHGAGRRALRRARADRERTRQCGAARTSRAQRCVRDRMATWPRTLFSGPGR